MSKDAVQRLQKLHNELKSVISIYEATNSARPLLSSNGPSDSVRKSQKPQQCQSKKPGSAPSRSSISTRSCEKNGLLASSSCAKRVFQAELASNKIVTPPEADRYSPKLSPSKSLEIATKFLTKNNYQSEEEILENDHALIHCDRCSDERESESSCEYTAIQGTSETRKKHSTACGNKLRAGDFEVEAKNRAQFEVHHNGQLRSGKPALTVIRPVTVKSCPGSQNEGQKLPATYTRHDIPKKIPRLDRHRSPQTAKGTDRTREGLHRDECEGTGRRHERSKSSREVIRTIHESRPERRNAYKSCQTVARRNRSEDTRRSRNTDFELQTLVKSQQLENTEFEANELSKIIERSQEKLEKMEVSKNLAIDIAKQLVSKYDEIKNSKNKLIDRLQKVEKDNERLSNEIRCEKETKIKLQRSLEEFRVLSKTTLLEREKRTHDLLEENAYLRSRIKEMEGQHMEDIMQKQKETERIFKQTYAEQNTEFGRLVHEKCTTSLHKRNEWQESLDSSENSITVGFLMDREKRLTDKRDLRQEEEVRRLTAENTQLLSKIEDLNRLLNEKQSSVESLESKMVELEEEVKRQRQSLRQKTDRLEDTNRELDSIRKNSKDLEDQVKLLRQSIENFDEMHQNMISKTGEYEAQIKKLQDQIAQLEGNNNQLRTDLENGKDSLLIKTKIIDDQQQTIKQLREKSDEIKTLMKKNQSLERLINIERDEKLELQDALERLKWRKDELKKKIKSLEKDLLLAPQEVVRDLQKTQMVLHELENQVQLKQKEWEIHLQTLIKEKEQACSVAEFATKKLMQTTNEFHKQSEAHKRLHKVLADNLAEKERYLREVNEKMSQAHFKALLPNPEVETFTRLTEMDATNGVDGWIHPRQFGAGRYLKCKDSPKFSIDF